MLNVENGNYKNIVTVYATAVIESCPHEKFDYKTVIESIVFNEHHMRSNFSAVNIVSVIKGFQIQSVHSHSECCYECQDICTLGQSTSVYLETPGSGQMDLEEWNQNQVFKNTREMNISEILPPPSKFGWKFITPSF